MRELKYYYCTAVYYIIMLYVMMCFLKSLNNKQFNQSKINQKLPFLSRTLADRCISNLVLPVPLYFFMYKPIFCIELKLVLF